MAIRVVSAGTTLVKRITVGTPTRIGNPSVGSIITLDDVNGSVDLSNGSYIRYDSSVGKFIHRDFDSDVGSLVAGQISIVTTDSGILNYTPATGVIDFNDSNLAVLDANRTFAQGTTIADGKKINFGSNVEADMFINDSNLFIRNNATGFVNIAVKQGNSIKFTEQDYNRNLATFDDLGAVKLYHEGNLKFKTDSYGICVTDEIRYKALQLEDSSGIVSTINRELLQVRDETTGLLETRRSTVFSTPDDDSGSFVFRTKSFGIENDSFDTILRTYDSGHVELYNSSVLRLATNDTGVKVTGVLDVTGSILYQNVFSTEGDLPNASTYHGMFAHVHATGKAYFSHAGAWHKLLDETTSTTTDLTEGTNLYYTTARADSDGKNALQAGTGITYTPASGTIAITNTGVDSGTYGSASLVPVITVNARGQIDSIGTVSVAGVSATSFDSAAGVFTINTADGGVFNTPVFTRELSRNALVAGSGIEYDSSSGVITVNDSAANVNFNTLTLAGQLRGPADLIIDPAGIGDNTGRVVIFGDLQVDGTTTTVNSTTVTVNDKNLVLADSAADSAAANGAGITVDGANATIIYNASTDTWDLNKPLGSIRNHLVNFTTDNLSEGSSNLYYTAARADSDGKNAISVTDAGGDGSLSYDAPTGVITYTGPSAAEVRAHFSAGTGIDIASGVVSGQDADSNNKGVASFSSANFTVAAGNVMLADTTVTAGTYGSASQVPVFTVNGKGQLDSAGTVSVAGVSSISFDSASYIYTISTADGGTYPQMIHSRMPGTSGTYGSASLVPIVTVNEYGLVDSISTTSVAGVSTFTFDSANATLNIGTADGGSFNARIGLQNFSTTDLSEGTNLYYTTARADSDARHAVSASGDLSYDVNSGVFSFDVEAVYTQANFDSDFNTSIDAASIGGVGLAYSADSNTLSIDSAELAAYFSTDNITEGTNLYYTDARWDTRLTTKTTTNLTEGSNLYYTTARADSDAKNAISVTDAGGDGSLTYAVSTGVITYTGPSATEVRSHLSVIDGISYDSSTGQFGLADITPDTVTANSITNTTGVTNTTPTQSQATSDTIIVVDNTAHGSDFTSIEYTVHMDDSDANHSQVSKVLLTYNKTDVFYTEYGVISSFSNDSDIGTLSADVNGANIRLRFQRATGMGTVNVKPIKTIIT